MIGEPAIPVECDRCSSGEDFEIPPSEVEGLYDARNLEAIMKRAGWIVTEEGDLCPICAEGEEGESRDIPEMSHMQGGPED